MKVPNQSFIDVKTEDIFLYPFELGQRQTDKQKGILDIFKRKWLEEFC